MKKLLPFLVVVIVVGALILGGCAQKTPAPTAAIAPSPSKTTTSLPSTTPALPPTTTKGTATTPAAATTKQPKYGGILRVLDMNQGVAFGYPVKMGTQYGNKQAGPAIETLIRTGKDGMPIPWLATGWTLDTVGKTITLPLRKGVKFHDGTDFNAKAAKWNLDQFLAAKYTGTSNIGSVDIIDDYTIRLNLTQWDSTILDAMTVMIGLEISPTAYETHGQQWCETHPVGTGPFEFVSYTPDVSTTYKKFNGYWQNGKPYLDGVEMRVILDMTTREYSFRKGEADVVVMLTQDQVNGLEKDGFVVDNIPSWKGTTFIAPDSKSTASPWSNVKVRQAAMYAIDNAGINEGVYSGKGIVSNQWTYQGHWAYNSSIVGYPYDATKAKQLLTEAGYPNGFKTTLSYVTDPTMDRIFTSVQSYLRR